MRYLVITYLIIAMYIGWLHLEINKLKPKDSQFKEGGSMKYTLRDFIKNLSNDNFDVDTPITDEEVINRINQALPKKYVIVETKRVKHYHVNNGVDDWCKQCGLYLTDSIHIREEMEVS